MEAILARRFSPLNFSAVPGFPNHVPTFIECADFLPMFQGDEGDNPAQHLIGFHQCIDQLNIHHEDALMKVFVYSLHGDARKWYHSLPAASISSLQEFHAAFHKYAKRYYSSDKLLEECCETYKFYIQQEEKCSSCDELSDDPIESKNEDETEFSDEDMGIILSLSNSQEQSFQGNIDDYTNDSKAALYPVSDAFDVSDLKEELVVKEDLSSFFQEVHHDVFSPEIKEEDQQVTHFSEQDQGTLGSPIFDEYSDEEEQIPFVDLRNNQPVYDSYELDFDEDLEECQNHIVEPISSSDGEQYCVENSYPESTEDIEQLSLEIIKPACTMLETGSADNNKQSIMRKEISLQPCSNLQTAESDSHSQEEDMQRFSDLQLKQQQQVFVFSFIDPFVDYLESLSSADVKLFWLTEDWLCCFFKLHPCIPWFSSFIRYRSEISQIS